MLLQNRLNCENRGLCALGGGRLIYQRYRSGRQLWQRNMSELIFEILSFITGEGGRGASAGEHEPRPDNRQSLLHKPPKIQVGSPSEAVSTPSRKLQPGP